MNSRLSRWLCLFLVLLCAILTTHAGQAQVEPLSFQRAVALALAHSTRASVADAEVQRALEGYRELRNGYIPQLGVGSGLGYSYGFPLTLEGSAPAVVNVVAQSTVFNPAQRQYLGWAKTELGAAKFQNQDERNGVIEDAAISYAELAKWEARLTRLQQDETQAVQVENAVAQRVQEGVDSAVDLNKAKLTVARVHLHLAEARGAADVLRRHLMELTGLPVSTIQIAPETIPALPPVQVEEDLASKAVETSPVIKSADQHALAETLRASAEHRLLLPSLDFAAQYARLSTYNNYDQYFLKFQPNNVTVGVAIRFPFLNAPQRSRAKAADAEALKAKKQAEATRNQVSEQTLKLQRAAEQLAAAREVAELEYQLAKSGIEAAQARADSGTGTFHELADARAQANERYLSFQDADFEYQRARVNLLRATGDLEKWALPNAAVK